MNLKKLYQILLLTSILLVCCTKDNSTDEQNSDSDGSDNKPTTSQYLSLDSQTEFDNLVQEFIAIENGTSNRTKSSAGAMFPSGFVSITQMESQQVSTKNPDGEEEMTQDEFNIMIAKSLLPDPVLCDLLDTTLRIAVGNEFYKITKYGTFITDKGNEEELTKFIDNFESVKDKYKMTEDDSILVISPKIKLLNTFRYSPIEDNLSYEGEEEPSTPTSKSSINEYAGKYGLTSHKWEGRTWFSREIWSFLGGDHSRENYFNPDRRVKLVLFNVNYGVYATSGLKVEMEQRKGWWKFKYWVDTPAENMAIGFNKFEATINYSGPIVNPYNNPSPSAAFSQIQAYINSRYRHIVYNGYSRLPFLSDWSSTILDFVPVIDFNIAGKNISLDQSIKNQVKELIERPDFVFSWLESLNNRYLFEPARKFTVPKDAPRALHTLIGVNKEKVYKSGVQEYGRMERKVVRFFSAAGITVSYGNGRWVLAPFLPARYSFDKIDLFGAVFYNGSWRGVRFYN